MRGAGAIARLSSAGAFRRPASAARSKPIDLRTRRPAARTLHRAAARRGGARSRWSAASRRCCFSTAAAIAPLTLVPRLRHRLHCPNCDAWLVDHRFKRRLVCHHCGFSTPPPAACPKCHATESFVAVGPGVERLEQEAAELFPGRAHSGAVERSGRIDRAVAQELDDVAAGPVRHRHRHAARRQGPSFPQAQSGRHRRRRSRPRQWRSARRRAHVSTAASGGRPRRPRGRRRARLSADASARASGDARADLRRPRGVL